MSLPFIRNFQTRLYDVTTTSSGGRPLQATIGARCKYLSTLFSLSGESTSGGTSGIDVFYYAAGGSNIGSVQTGAPTSITITSGFTISTSTGNCTFQYTSTGSVFLNQGDILVTSGSTGIIQYNATHIVQEF